MAELNFNPIVDGASGKFGRKLVFQQRAGKTVMASAPGKRKKEPTEDQKAHYARFAQAILFGQKMLADPEKKKMYDAAAPPGQSGYNVAVADFLNKPAFVKIDLSAYSGEIGQLIIVEVKDDFKINSVAIKIENADGSLVEEGAAVSDGSGIVWTYTTTVSNTSTEGDKITITASDIPANLAVHQETF
ncbi:MAG: hypothetical protein WCF67_04945 [Chitinophagaceae bacterium]